MSFLTMLYLVGDLIFWCNLFPLPSLSPLCYGLFVTRNHTDWEKGMIKLSVISQLPLN